MKKYVILAVIVIVVGGVGYYFLGSSGAKQQSTAGQVQRVVTVGRGDLNLIVSANGVVQPINKVEIRSKASGQIVELTFEEGQYVGKGSLLIGIDQTQTKNDFDQAKADLALAEAAISQAENNNKRARELFNKKLISEQERDQSGVDYVRAQSQLVKAKAVLSSAEDRLRDTRILAPISGVILSRSVELGQIIASAVSNVGGGTLLATIADMDMVHVETNVDEVDIGKVKVGQSAKIIADAYPEDTFRGEVIRISPLGKTLQNVTTFNVIILVRNLGGKLKAGMSTSVDIEVFNRKNVVLVPNEALKDPRSEQGRVMLASANLSVPEEKPVAGSDKQKKDDGKRAATTEQFDPAKFRERMQSASPEERQKLFAEMKERFEKMSPEERERARSQMGGRFQRGGGQAGQSGGSQGQQGGTMFRMDGSSGMMGGGSDGAGGRVRRQSQVSNEDEVRWRIVAVKEGVEFKPRLVKVGPNNFDNSEVLEGLKEGEEIQITTVSRAKLASEQFNERMRNMSGMSGLGGGGTRVPRIR
ncbi:MAG: efflux RND transporter periplasmic adaptor subunit [Ignavibacteriales bacterium]|nr:efflux RND transporter periplasmic adaptor subunit [Ignavibacteriales bacterium]